MPAKEGDFILVNYTLRVKESGETVDTTIDSVAKEARLHKGEDAVFEPRFIVLGEGWFPKGLEESLVGTEPGIKKTVELTPEKGYGPRDPGKMRLVPLRRFREKGEEPIPGRQVELDGRPAVVRAVGAGRVQVDYNHPLAGRTLVYDVSIEKLLEDRSDKLLSLVSRKIPEVAKDKFEIREESDGVTIEIPEEAFYLSGLQVAKKSISADLEKYFPKIDTIAFREVYKRTSPNETKASESTPTETVLSAERGKPVEKPVRKASGTRKRASKAKVETAAAESE